MPLSKTGTLLIATIAGIGIAAFIRAQESPTYKVDVRAVNVLATVHDHNGRIASDLTKDDFILEEDGKQQEIRYFSRQTDLPLKIGLLIDTSGSQRNLIEEERRASYQFLDLVLRPDRDQAFVIQFDSQAELLQDLTNSRDSLQKALNSLKGVPVLRRPANGSGTTNSPFLSFVQSWPGGIQIPGIPGGQRPPGGGGGGSGGSGGRRGGTPGGQGRQTAGGTVLYDAVFLASDEILQNLEGRKAIILISDGVDRGSKVSEKEATAAAHHADTLVYSIRYFDSSAYGGRSGGGMGRDEGAIGTKTLNMLSQETGGREFEVSKKLSLKEIYERIQEELRNQYNLGYTPSNTTGNEFRYIKLRTKDNKLEVVTRAGYYPK
jgi:VWFA-related protein